MMKDIKRGVCGILVLVAGGVGAGACTASVQEDEAVGEDSSALGEDACKSTDKDDDAVAGACSNAGFSVSPDATYDHAGCSHQYVVGYGALPNDGIHARVSWEGDPLTSASACEAAHLTLAAYTEASGSWTVQTTRMHGVWSPFTTPACRFAYDTGFAALDTIGSGNKHRLAASAYQTFITSTGSGFPTFQEVMTYSKVAVQMYVNAVCPPN